MILGVFNHSQGAVQAQLGIIPVIGNNMCLVLVPKKATFLLEKPLQTTVTIFLFDRFAMALASSN